MGGRDTLSPAGVCHLNRIPMRNQSYVHHSRISEKGCDVTEKHEESEITFRAQTGELYSLDKNERILLREVLRVSLITPSGKKVLEERFGKYGFKIAVSLLEQMGVEVKKVK